MVGDGSLMYTLHDQSVKPAQCCTMCSNTGKHGGGGGGGKYYYSLPRTGSSRVPALLIGAGTRDEPLRTSAWEASITKPGQPKKGMSFRFFFFSSSV